MLKFVWALVQNVLATKIITPYNCVLLHITSFFRQDLLNVRIPVILKKNCRHFGVFRFYMNYCIIIRFGTYIFIKTCIIKGILFPDIFYTKLGSWTLFVIWKFCLRNITTLFELLTFSTEGLRIIRRNIKTITSEKTLGQSGFTHYGIKGMKLSYYDPIHVERRERQGWQKFC